MFQRKTLITQLETTKDWDVIIIGGGATGLGVALDCTTRGYKTLLLEQVDFAKGTSSRSTKLVHGGVRYLAQGNIHLVREALYERGLLLKNASHLVRKQSFIIPNYSWWDNIFYTIGLKVYDFLSGKLSFGQSVRINKKEIISRLSNLKTDALKCGVVYHDGQFDDSRLALNIAQTCIEKGATVLNHFKINNLLKTASGIINGIVATDNETDKAYHLKAKVVVNATGVFTDEILKMDDTFAQQSIRPSQGIHLVIDKSFLPGEDAILIPETADGRVLFLVPWHNRVLVGTTDTLLDSHSLEPKPLDEEVDFIIETANRYLLKAMSKADVLSVFAGLRPLVVPKNKLAKTKDISRTHKITVSKSELISITGGKWTTYRRMAEDTVNKIIDLEKLPKKLCKTSGLPIHGSNEPSDRKSHLSIYGTDQKEIENIKKEDLNFGELLHPKLEFTKAEVIFAVRNEMARTIEDVLARRVRILFLDARVAIVIAPDVGELLKKELGKSDEWCASQVLEFRQLAQQYILANN